MLNFTHLVKVASPSEAPHEGIILYFPRINHDMFCVPMEGVENIIQELEEQFGKDVGYAIRAALQDCIHPFQKVIVVIEGSKRLVYVHGVDSDSDGRFCFSYAEYIKQYPTLESITKEQTTIPSCSEELNKVRKSLQENSLNTIASTF